MTVLTGRKNGALLFLEACRLRYQSLLQSVSLESQLL